MALKAGQLKIWVHLNFVLVHLKKKLGAPVQPMQKLVWSPDIDEEIVRDSSKKCV